MKNIAILFGIVLLLITITGSSDHISDYQENGCKRKHLITSEPGTCLRPDAYRILKIIKKIRENPLEEKKNMKIFDVLEPRVVCVKDTLINANFHTIPLRIYYPSKKCLNEPHPIVFFIHGGAFMYGDIDQYDMLVKKIARTTNSIVTSVEYRLAPDHPYPCAIEDSYCALSWVANNAVNLGGIKEGICIMGSSAGGNIATVLTLKSKELGHPKIACQILYYPPTTFVDTEFPSRHYFLRDSLRSYFLTEEIMKKCKEKYLGSYTNVNDPYLSPLEAELSPDLPPALIFTAQCDPLRDEAKLYAQKLEEAGIEVIYKEYEGMIHGFLSFYMVLNAGKNSLRTSRDFIAEQIEINN